MVRLCSALKEAKEKARPHDYSCRRGQPGANARGAPQLSREVGWAVGELCHRGVTLGF